MKFHRLWVVVCWDPSGRYLDIPCLTLAVADDEESAIGKVKAVDPEEGKEYKWFAERVYNIKGIRELKGR